LALVSQTMSFLYYQNIDGLAPEKPNRKGSAYWNEGKWTNYIRSLLPESSEDMTLVEVGSNAGLFLKLAKDRGFRNVIGIEREKDTCERAIRHRDALGYDYEILNRAVGEDFSFDEIPLADITLISNTHYYFKLGDWLNYLNALRVRTCYCLIVSRYVRPRRGMPVGAESDIKYYFKDWPLVDARFRVNYGRKHERPDSCPTTLQSYLFKGQLERVKIKDIRRGSKFVRIPGGRIRRKILLKQFFDLTGGLENSLYYKSLFMRVGRRWSKENITNYIKEKHRLAESIRKEGQKEPVLLGFDNKLIDGGHRIAAMEYLGYKSVIARKI